MLTVKHNNMTLRYWNHNVAYYPWIKEKVKNCHNILDVGCGDGQLVNYLADGNKRIAGIDVDSDCINRAINMKTDDKVSFSCCGFDDFSSETVFDAIIFVASVHHMDMEKALVKARALLSSGGRIIIVGLGKPSTVSDYIIEALRIIPSKVVSLWHHMSSSEKQNIPVDYHFPTMEEIRNIVKKELPGAKMRYALHYRYLLEWVSE